MHCTLILRELTAHELLEVKANRSKPGHLIISANTQDLPDLAQQALTPLSEDEKRDINTKAMDDILAFGDTPVMGVPISERLSLSGAGLWYYHKFRIYFLLRNKQYRIAEINKNLKEAHSATIYADVSWLTKEKIEVPSRILLPRQKKERLKPASMLAYGCTVIFRWLRSWTISPARMATKEILCIDTADQYRNILSTDGKQQIFENAYLGYFYQQYGDQCAFIDQLLVPKFKGADHFTFNKKYLKNHNHRMRLFAERILARGMLSMTVWRAHRHNIKKLTFEYELIQNQLQQQQTKLDILQELQKLHATSAFYLYKYFCYDRFFKNYSFQCVLTTDENSPNFKIILDAARKHHIFTAGYQHGSIHTLHPAYRYTTTDLKSRPMPDITITWGKKWADLMIQTGHYPEDKVTIAGQVRTDVIPNMLADEQIQKEKIFPQAGDQKIVLFATQPQRDPTLRKKAAEDVAAACLKQQDTHLVFKLHPRENDPDFYRGIAYSMGLRAFSVAQDIDLYTLLKVADVVITCFSTVGTEALYFGKPLIILDHLNQDLLHYYRDGVAFQATDAITLAEIMGKVLSGQLQPDKEILKKYLLESTYRIDGQTASRVWSVIQNHL